MAHEIEIKAHVTDCGTVVDRLERIGEFVRTYHRRDRYYGSRPGSDTRFRVRIEDDSPSATVTIKNKSIDNGLEHNREVEFTVQDVAAFDSFVRMLGYVPVIEKEKRGRLFRVRGMSVECNDVTDLGMFVEVEKLLPDTADDRDVHAASVAVRALLAEIGIDEAAVEPRPYTVMLAALAVR